MAHYYDAARTSLELCRFAYKMYAQTVTFPYDPFFESDAEHTNTWLERTRNRMMDHIHDKLTTPQGKGIRYHVGLGSSNIRKFDPIQYNLDSCPNPSKGAIYRGDIDNSFTVFAPGTFDKKISHCKAFKIDGNETSDGGVIVESPGGNLRCGYFQGQTGQTLNYQEAGWTSFLGAVIYDPVSNHCYIVYRGSRSGYGKRAAMGAQFKSKGNPDWVTDMNHLKEYSVAEITDLNGPNKETSKTVRFASGFWFAHYSARASLAAAYRFAVQGATPSVITVTGHSLGGALAQCGYIDLCAGKLGRDLNLNISNADSQTVLECYPISAPPVCLGVNSQHWVSRNANASNVHHYYCPYDAVHGCNLVLGGTETKVSKVTSVAHPATSPFHFGSQLALNSTEPFPGAHEPLEVWRALYNDQQHVPGGFWQKIEFDRFASTFSSASPADPITNRQIAIDAISDSFKFDSFMERAKDWAAGISKDSNKGPAMLCIQEVEYCYAPENYLNPVKYRELAGRRQQLIKSINISMASNTSDTAGCVYHTLLVAIGMQRIINGVQTM